MRTPLRHCFLGLLLLCAAVRPAAADVSVGAWLEHSPDDLNTGSLPGLLTMSADNQVTTVTLPFSITIEGVAYNTVAVSTNGWLEFGGNTQGTPDQNNTCLPTASHTNPFVAAYWDDLVPEGNVVRYGTVGTAPNRTFVVDWEAFINPSPDSANDGIRFQALVHEGSNVVNVRYQFNQVQTSGTTATIGYQGAGGASANAQAIGCNARVLDDNRNFAGWSADVGRAGRPILAGMVGASPDDLSGFTTLSGNDSVATPSIGFNVNIQGVNYNSVAISTNGWLEFGGNTSGSSDPNNVALPAANHTNPFLAAFWDDLQTQGTAVRYGLTGTSPNRVFYVDYVTDLVASGSGDLMPFQVQIHEGSNLITVKYRDTGSNACGQTATIGFQGAGGASALALPLGFNARILDDNRPNAQGWSVHAGAGRPQLHGVLQESPDDISGFTSLSGDNAIAGVTMPFSITIDGASYNTATIGTNGIIQFGTTTGSNPTANTALPSSQFPNPTVFFYWDDLVPEANNIRYGTVGTSPNRVYVVDFNMRLFSNSGQKMNGQVQIHEGSNAIIVEYRDDLNFEATGRSGTIGFQGAGGASAQAYPLTFNGQILDDNIPNAGWSVTPLPVCGNGTIESLGSEQCDLGAANGSATSCCTATCTFRTSGSTCRGSAGACDVVETCSGASATCPADGFVASGTGCRSAAGICDVAESCTGSSAACPTDLRVAAGVQCRGAAGVCDVAESCDGANVDCPADLKSTAQCRGVAGDCDVAESCNGVSNDCPADGFASSATVCRGAAGICDVAENCTGTGAACPANVLVAAGTECRGSAGICDVAEACTGASAACPTDGFVTAGVECRGSAGICDVAESCTGSGPACPADVLVAAGVECRGAAGICDLAEACDGSSVACPADAKSTAVCRGAAGDCDVAESCDGVGNDCPTDAFVPSSTTCRAAAGDCDVAESCTGSAAACPADGFVASGTACRAAAGVCDVAETCTGAEAACPADARVAAGTECRSAAGDCDLAESCDGTDVACPADVKSTSVCRPSAGDCDVAETCDGVADNCPADAFAPSSTTCRAAAGDCDVAESCTGSGAACPADGFVASGTVCRSAGGVCDVAESCTGTEATCPSDVLVAAGTECRGAAGDCDLAESCDGSTAACPADVKSTSVCRPAAGDCDVAETCDGSSNACPSDVLATAGSECRVAAGDCDVAESCSGSSAACPTDGFVGAGTECRASAGDCDVAETCTGSGPACPSDVLATAGTECRASAGDCDVAETCNGTDAACPSDSVAGAFVVCRPSAGDCDLPESCDGAGTACPADVKSTAVCRSAAGDCDVAETCDGVGDACPADVKHSAGTACRASTGDCDAAETCDGSTDACPADAKKPASTPCRASAGICDVAESCDGTTDACPADAFAPSTTECRPSSGDACDVAEMCTGTSAVCPADTGAPDGDGDGVCDSSDLCATTPDPTNADGDGDGLGDACDPCTNVFNGGTFATKTKLVATKVAGGPGDDRLKVKGFVLIPTTPTIAPDVRGVRIILAKQDGSTIVDAMVPGGTYSAATRAGWRTNGSHTKFLYKNAGTAVPLVAGIAKLSLGLSAKTPGLLKVGLSGKAGTYGPVGAADLPLRWTIIVDVPQATTGQCGESNYGAAGCLISGGGNTVKCSKK